MDKIDIAVIGGGVVGLAVASRVARSGRDVFIFERNGAFGQEASSRNSEVIHSGIYYPSWSLKKKTCIEGAKALYRICAENGIPHKKTGKLIVAKDISEIEALEDLFAQGKENGLDDIRLIESGEIRAMEPNVTAIRAIYLPMTGIVDSHALMKYFLAKARDGGADIICGSDVKKIDPASSGFVLTALGGGRHDVFFSKVVINCAGLDSDIVSKMAGISGADYSLSYCKGDYFRVRNGKERLVGRLVYPVVKPGDAGLGIHLTVDLAGGVRLGPDAEYLLSRKRDYSVDPRKRDMFYESVRSFLPFLEKDDLSADTSGIRPKLQKEGGPFRDFLIRHEEDKGLKGFINLVGIESPGLTASPAIAEMVEGIVNQLVG